MSGSQQVADRRGGVRSFIPGGSAPVGVGLIVLGISAYGFLVVAGRTLGPSRYGALSVEWALVFLVGPGVFLPLEQEVGRTIASRRARGLGAAPVVRRAALAGGVLAVVLVALTAVAAPALLHHLFDDQVLLVAGLAVSLVAYFVAFLLRGLFAGNGRFHPYGATLGAEGLARLVPCLVLAAVGVQTAGPYGLVVGAAPLIAIAIALPVRRGLVTPGPDKGWGELSRALGYLLAGSLLAQLLVNVGPLTVKALAPAGEDATVGHFLAGVVIARVPLFLFQAVEAALLPGLAALAASGRHEEFRTGLARLMAVIVAVGVAATLGAMTIGPSVLKLVFGPDFELARHDLAFLTGASAVYLLAEALAQALIAKKGHAEAAAAWFIGVLVFGIVVAVVSDLLPRVEYAFLAGSTAAAAAMLLFVLRRLDQSDVITEPLAVGAPLQG
jgi:O-antigen/teichoic acid export membrane protein